MLILPQLIKMNWNNGNKDYYINKGYKFTKIKDEFFVHVLDISKQSHKKVKVYCDYCGKILEKPFRYIKENSKDCCEICSPLKLKENNLEKYGVGTAMERKEIKRKTAQTNLKKYGYKCTLQIPEIREKVKETNLSKYNNTCSLHGEEIDKKTRNTWLKKYGVDHPLKSKEIRLKIKKTNISKYGCEVALNNEEYQKQIKENNLEKYGVEYSWQREDVKEKIKKTTLERYGVTHLMKDESYRNKVLSKVAKSLYINGTGKCSKYQKHLNEIVNGKLNYPVDKCMLDIAFPNEMIYIEYNGGGHYVYNSIDEVNKHDMKRQYFLKSKGWKLIKIISINNKELNDKTILKLIKIGKEYLLNTQYSWMEIDIDNMLIKCTEYIKNITEINEKVINDEI